MTLLYEAAIFLAAAVIAVPLFRRIGFGSVLGYLAAGLAIGPHGFGLVTDVEDILQFSKIGVVLLLFIIGLELQPARLWVLRRNVFGLGSLQLLACSGALGTAAWMLGLSPGAALVVGVGLAFSSTALVLQLLAERESLTTRHGRAAFAILLFKYIALLPLLAVLPMLGGGADGLEPRALAIDTVVSLAVIAAIVVGGHVALRPIFRLVAATGTHETFAATALLVVIGSALAVDATGLSMGVGALVAGVLLADSEFRHEIEADIEPFKGLLLGLFFIAVGMSADLGLVVEESATVFGLAAGLIAIKLALIYTIGRAWGLGDGQARSLAAVLPQGGELAFVVFSSAAQEGVLTATQVDYLIAAVTLSMVATPLTVLFNERVLAPRLDRGDERVYDTIDAPAPGVIIAGFGRFGQIVGRVLHSANVPFTALEINPVQVDFVRRYGNRLYYGDASRIDLLRSADAGEARAFVLTIDDVEASVRTAEAVRRHFPNLPIFARARNRQHAFRLKDLGARIVVRETFPASLELGEGVLAWATGDEAEAREAVAGFREHDEAILERQYAVHRERDALQLSTSQAADELEGLFERDDAEDTTPGDPDAPPRSGA
jgi:glutathione-regulated potassium-efflux system ancillary protein KefC/glutathione-regulated potassium-efflux system protein KefB